LKLKAKTRHLRRNPGNIALDNIQTDREELSTLFVKLKELQHVAGVAEPNAPVISSSESLDTWDDLAFDPVVTGAEGIPPPSQPIPSTTNNIGQIRIEDQIIALPSNGNTSANYRNLEIAHRISMAEEQLNHIRNLIAEKSFQFSHVIRVSPRKGVTTRARAAVRKLNNIIAEHCRFYSRCRAALLVLEADPLILSRYMVLNPDDIVGSTVILNPNQPGSTSIKLSWIWQTSARHIVDVSGPSSNVGRVVRDLPNDPTISADDMPSIIECISSFPNFILFMLT
jgi:hypothetical protein